MSMDFDIACLRSPCEPDDVFGVVQLIARAKMAADQIEALAAQRDELHAALKGLYHLYVVTMENARDRIVSLGGKCDLVEVMEEQSPELTKIRVLMTRIEAAR